MKFFLRFLPIISALAFSTIARGAAVNAWHIPFNNTDLSGTSMRSPYVEISNNPASPTTITIYEGFFKNNGAGGNQNGGGVWYKGASQSTWLFTAFLTGAGDVQNIGLNQYWKATISSSAVAANEVIQYYIQVNTDGSQGVLSSFIYAPGGKGDLGGSVAIETTASSAETTARANPFTIRNRPAWVFHANNRVLSGSNVQFWAKVGYMGDANDLATRWADNGRIYYTTDGSEPAPGATAGTATGTTQMAAFTYDHPETGSQGQSSIAGAAMWWMASVSGLPEFTTIKYKIGFWHSANGEQKFADHNAGTNDQTFSFTIGATGGPALTVNGLSANYTTTKFFIDELAGETQALTASFTPGQAVATDANGPVVEVFTNLDRRDFTDSDIDGDGVEDAIKPPYNNDATQVTLTHAQYANAYFRPYRMTAAGSGVYTWTTNVSKTGAYRVTARFKRASDNAWVWYGQRDHAVVVSPKKALEMTLYEVNPTSVEAFNPDQGGRSTFEDLLSKGEPFVDQNANNVYDLGEPFTDTNKNGVRDTGPDQDGRDFFNLEYLDFLQVNCLWFQPIHPPASEVPFPPSGSGAPSKTEGYTPGSPYGTKDYWQVSKWLGSDPTNPTEADAMADFQAFVGQADIGTVNMRTVNVMLDGVFNHTSWDAKMGEGAIELNQRYPGHFTSNPDAYIHGSFPNGAVDWYSLASDYGQRATYFTDYYNNDIATAPDRGDFGKWSDVAELCFGDYSALVNHNLGASADNGDYNNEGDLYFYSSMNGATIDLWRYFGYYTEYWLRKTRGDDAAKVRNSTAGDGNYNVRLAWDDRGIDALRCDFGQGLPPQIWEYIINRTRHFKWNFVFMAETLDGGSPGYRSNRHFDILNENLVFQFTQAHINSASVLETQLESRRATYHDGAVLLNLTGHDEVMPDNDPWVTLSRYGAVSSVYGLPMVFNGQEKGIGLYDSANPNAAKDGFALHESNFGKWIPHFKQWNKLTVWDSPPPDSSGLDQVYGRINSARLNSPALRSHNQYYLRRKADGAPNNQIFAVAKYETPGGSPASSDVVLAFTNFLPHSGAHSVAADTYDLDGPSAALGLKANRSYNIRNLASANTSAFIWPSAKSGSDLQANGIFVSLPAGTGANPIPYDGEVVQYLKLVDVTAPTAAAGAPAGSHVYNYAIGNSVAFTWPAVAPDSEGIVPKYRVNVSVDGGPAESFITSAATYTRGNLSPGQTVSITVQAVNPADTNSAGPVSASSGAIKILDAVADEDGDGQSNQIEDTAGTNPLSGSSFFRVTSITRDDDAVTIEWNSAAGKSYKVETATSLAPNAFSELPIEVPSAGATTSYTDSAAPDGRKFYRVRVAP